MIGLQHWAQIISRAKADTDYFGRLTSGWESASSLIDESFALTTTHTDKIVFMGDGTRKGYLQALNEPQASATSLDEYIALVLATCRPRCIPSLGRNFCFTEAKIDSATEEAAVKTATLVVAKGRDLPTEKVLEKLEAVLLSTPLDAKAIVIAIIKDLPSVPDT